MSVKCTAFMVQGLIPLLSLWDRALQVTTLKGWITVMLQLAFSVGIQVPVRVLFLSFCSKKEKKKKNKKYVYDTYIHTYTYTTTILQGIEPISSYHLPKRNLHFGGKMTQLPKQLHQQMHLLMQDDTFLYDVSTYSWVKHTCAHQITVLPMYVHTKPVTVKM